VQLLGKLLTSYESALRADGQLPARLDGGADDRPQTPPGDGNGNGNGTVAAGDEPSSSGGAANGSSNGGGGPVTTGLHALRPIELSDAQKRSDEQERDVLTWVLHCLSQHRSWLGDTEGALAASDEALRRSPDIVELHSERGAVLAAAGDVEGVCVCVCARVRVCGYCCRCASGLGCPAPAARLLCRTK